MKPPGERPSPPIEAAAGEAPETRYVLRLYVTGMAPRSLAAIENTRRVCEEFLEGRYELEVLDISQNPELAAGAQIVAAPTLIKELPEPLRRLVGDLSLRDRVLRGLDLRLETGGSGSEAETDVPS
jgi:circadian clock protein KaiB